MRKFKKSAPDMGRLFSAPDMGRLFVLSNYFSLGMFGGRKYFV
jgi:hypothetical protein